MTPTPVATRYECTLRDHLGAGRHLSGNGKPTRKRCACGGAFIVLRGRWGVFLHSAYGGDARYLPEMALASYASEAAAERDNDARNAEDTAAGRAMRHVVRWIPAA